MKNKADFQRDLDHKKDGRLYPSKAREVKGRKKDEREEKQDIEMKQMIFLLFN